jgi:hypothetical protein
MKEPFPHDIRAVLAAPAKGFSLKKISAATLFLLAGYLVYVIFTYLALLYDGVSFDYLWQSHGFFPLKLFPFDALAASVIYTVGASLAVFSFSLALMAGAVINFEELRGDFFYSAVQAVRFALSRITALFLCYLSLAAFVGFICLLGLMVGIAGRIPVIGGLAIGVFYIVPIFITLVFTLFIVFAAIISIVLLPVIVAAQKKGETFDALLQLFSVLTREPVRFFWYLAISAGLAKMASFVFAYVFYRTIQFSQLVLSRGGGERIERMFNAALAVLPLDSPFVSFVTNIFPGIPFGFTIVRWGYGADTSVGAALLSISFFVLFTVICGYMVSVLSAGLARGYAVIRRMKDDYLIVDEEPLETRDDYANPPFRTEDNDS